MLITLSYFFKRGNGDIWMFTEKLKITQLIYNGVWILICVIFMEKYWENCKWWRVSEEKDWTVITKFSFDRGNGSYDAWLGKRTGEGWSLSRSLWTKGKNRSLSRQKKGNQGTWYRKGLTRRQDYFCSDRLQIIIISVIFSRKWITSPPRTLGFHQPRLCLDYRINSFMSNISVSFWLLKEAFPKSRGVGWDQIAIFLLLFHLLPMKSIINLTLEMCILNWGSG